MAGLIVVGGTGVGLGRRYIKNKEDREKAAAAPTADTILLHQLHTLMVGAQPTFDFPFPEHGLIQDVADLKKGYAALDRKVDGMAHGLVPNGGDSDHVGDVLQRQGLALLKIMDFLKIPKDES